MGVGARVPDPPTASGQAPVGSRTSSSPAQGSSLSPTPIHVIPDPSLTPSPDPPEARWALTCGGKLTGGPGLQGRWPLVQRGRQDKEGDFRDGHPSIPDLPTHDPLSVSICRRTPPTS